VIKFTFAQILDLTFTVPYSNRERIGAVYRTGYKFKLYVSWEKRRVTFCGQNSDQPSYMYKRYAQKLTTEVIISYIILST